MPETIDPTWLAWAAPGQPIPDERIAAGLERIERHYGRLVDYELERHARQEETLGIATIGDADSRGRWPHFAEDAGVAIASAYAPTGWERIVAERDPQQAPLPLARALLARPEDSDLLNAPAVLAVLDRGAGRLLVLGDAIGAGRIYQMRFDGCIAWSNRAGALPLFAGRKPDADAQGWRLLAAASWPLGLSTPLANVLKSGPGTLAEATREGVTQRRRDGLGELLSGSGRRLGSLADEAAEQARAQAEAAGTLWDAGAEVDLSGGRDSRVVAAAAVAAGIDARLHTSDINPGEADVARRLVAAAPRRLEHDVKRAADSEVKPRKTPLLERARNVHLVHDGMRHPQKLRGEMALPRRRPTGATLSGHGGEIAHGFFYKSGREARRLHRGGGNALVERVMRFFAKGIGAARPEATEEARDEVEASLARGRELGLDGPVLLDYFYLVDRFAHRSGVGAHAERISVFTVPAFVRAAFSLSLRQRVGARLHEAMIERLVPEWSAIPFYEAERSAMPRVRRLRLWESADDAAAIAALLEGGGSWEELYDSDRVRAAWEELRAGGGAAKWEAAFEGIAYRAAFDDYLSELAAAAAVGPPLIER